MPVLWKSEACDQPLDRETGVFSVRLTAAALHSINIYCEQPYTSPDGRRIAILRSPDPDPRLPPYELLVADVYSYRSTSVEKGAISNFVGTASWTGWIYYVTAAHELARVNIMTLEKQILWTRWPFSPDFVLPSVSADHQYLIGVQFTADHHSQIIRIDLHERAWKIIYEHNECLGHLQFNPVPNAKNGLNNHILVQLNRRVGYNHMWEGKQVENPLGGATHFLIDADGGNRRPLPIGEPYTISSAGHCAWMAETGRICVASHWDFETWKLDPRWPQGNVFSVAAGEDAPKVFPCPDHRFNHVGVSRCGKYFVCDSYWKRIPGPIALVVGNLHTGKHRVLLSDCRASGGGPASGHPHAYFTADSKHVIYNADPYWIGQVFAARVPEGFLQSLD